MGGTSMGGVRPKVVVEDNEGLWIAKFNRVDDRWNNAQAERAMLRLARACGIQTSDSRLTTIGDRDAILVKRSDRERAANGYRRARMLSALTLLRAEENEREKWSRLLKNYDEFRLTQKLMRGNCIGAWSSTRSFLTPMITRAITL